jgi:hypothetical protein
VRASVGSANIRNPFRPGGERSSQRGLQCGVSWGISCSGVSTPTFPITATAKMAVPTAAQRDLFQRFSRATLGAMPLWLLTYKFTCSQAECVYHNALDAVVQADSPRTAASQVAKSQHHCGRCGRPLTNSSSLKIAAPVPMLSVEKMRPVSESGKQP